MSQTPNFNQHTSQAKQLYASTSVEDISAALQYISPNMDRDNWARIGMAIQNELGEAGFDMFDSWSASGDTYKASEMRSTWRSFKPNGNDSKPPATIATLFKMANDNGHKRQSNARAHTTNPRPPKRAATDAEAAQKRQIALDKAQTFWGKGKPATSHPYAEKKGHKPEKLRVSGDALLVPMYNASKKLSSVQIIQPDGKKLFLQGCAAAGCYFPIGKPTDDMLVIVEGWATGMSIHTATGLAVAVAFSSGNLPKVAGLMREKHPDYRIILAPDNDNSRHAIHQAETAARDYGCEVVIPQFPEGTDGTDFNDMHLASGLDEVKRQIKNNCYQPEAINPPIHDCKLVNMDSIVMEPLEWLWPGRFPLGKLCLLGGKPGVGKTQISLSIAAIVTIGGKWFDSGTIATLGKVLFLTSEDDLADTVKPRLVAAGADTSKVIVLKSVARKYEDQVIDGFFSLGQDIQQLHAVLNTNPGIRLVIFDPLQAYLGVKDAHRNADVRAVLGPLADLASKHRVTVLGIEHLGKSAGRVDPMAAFLGSTGIIASARSAYLVCKDKADDGGDRLFLPVKQNLSEEIHGLTYRLIGKTLNNNIETSCIEWTGHTEQTARDALDETGIKHNAPAEADAEDFLLHLLGDGPVKVAEIRDQVKDSGHAWRTVERAKSNLGFKAKNRGHLYGNAWWWMTPEQLAEDEADLRVKNADSGGRRQHIRAGGLPQNEPKKETQKTLETNTGNGLSDTEGSPPSAITQNPDGGLLQEGKNTPENTHKLTPDKDEMDLL